MNTRVRSQEPRELTQGSAVRSPRRVPSSTQLVRCRCPSAAPRAAPQDPTSSPGKGPPSEGEAAAQSTVTTPRSSSSPQPRLGPAQGTPTLSPGLDLIPAPLAPSRAAPRPHCSQRLHHGESPCQFLGAATAPGPRAGRLYPLGPGQDP